MQLTSTVLVFGASGATGLHLVRALLAGGHTVRAVVRSADKLPDDIRQHANTAVVIASVADMTDAEMADAVRGCGAVLSCLGHNMTFRGMYRDDRLLITNALRRLVASVEAAKPVEKVKFVLMNTVGAANPDADDDVGCAQSCATSCLRCCVPPHGDNEQAAEYLRSGVGQHHPSVEWVVVRPDGLTDDAVATPSYAVPSPVRSIFSGYVTSRANVGAFMARLAGEPALWARWAGAMPVLYDRVQKGVVTGAPEPEVTTPLLQRVH
jgi:nucleoside-diphosphate-sugar epimerase